MMKKKHISILFLTFFLAISLLTPKQNVLAAKQNVTKTFKDKKKIEKIFGESRDLLGVYTFYKLAPKKKVTLDFSKDSHRRKFMEYTYSKYGRLSLKRQQSLSKGLFGKTVSKKATQFMGDWGCSWPVSKINKIYKISANTYQVSATVYQKDGETKKLTKEGTAVFTLKKSSKAKYGYYITKLTIAG
ncbi:MAG: hypothetical protein MR380_00510 [Lachnospiraceae bacterium]|nr:hypothetical protein [Lachnospiraceae bacterium]